ncbi:MAG: SpoIIE family protein phosphatase [Acidobacteriota bacterium]
MPYLHVIQSDGTRSSRKLCGAAPLTIGRSSRNDIVLADLSLSRKHAELRPQDDGWVLQDCKSRNGTFLNGRRIDLPSRLSPGDRITLGSCNLTFQEQEEEPSSKVFFSNQPMVDEGTIILPLNDVMTMPDSAPQVVNRPSSEDLQARVRRLQVIEKANLELLAHQPIDGLLPKILDLVSSAVNPDRAALLLLDAQGKLVCRAFRGDEKGADLSISRTIANEVMERKVAILTSDAQADSRFKEGASIMVQGIHSVMAVPLWNNKDVIGLIYADSHLASGLFDHDDLRVLTMLANIAGIQIENSRLFGERLEKQRFEQEVRAAADIQKRLLPSCPPVFSGYKMVGMNIPCYEVGGDYFDFLAMEDQRWGIVVADVAGKGMGAAMLMAALQASVHAHVENGLDPSQVLDNLNGDVARTAPANRYATLVFLQLDPSQHIVRFINAGHAPAPLLVRRSGETEELKASGLPLGILPRTHYPVGQVQIEPGDFLLTCSDGVTETVDSEGNEFGEERLRRLVASLAGQSPGNVKQAVEEALEEYAGGTDQPDDLTLVILQRAP